MDDIYVALDLETTGLNPKHDRIIEAGAVKIINGRVMETFESLISPGRKLEERIPKITGITDEMLMDAPEPDIIIPKLIQFIGENILVGHSILFDFSFIKREAVNRKISFEKKGIDTLKLARKFLSDLESKKLEDLCIFYGIRHKAHRALADAQAAAELYEKLKEQFYEEDSFKPYDLIYHVKKENPITRVQKERLYKLLDKHKIVLDYEIDKLTKNEASRITDKILAKCGR